MQSRADKIFGLVLILAVLLTLLFGGCSEPVVRPTDDYEPRGHESRIDTGYVAPTDTLAPRGQR